MSAPLRLSPLRRWCLELAAAGGLDPFTAPMGRPQAARAGKELAGAGLLEWTPSMGWLVTDAGRAALTRPFVSRVDAHDAARRWRAGCGKRVMGWVVLPCKGGGFAVRVGVAGAPSVLLPEGIDRELVRG